MLFSFLKRINVFHFLIYFKHPTVWQQHIETIERPNKCRTSRQGQAGRLSLCWRRVPVGYFLFCLCAVLFFPMFLCLTCCLFNQLSMPQPAFGTSLGLVKLAHFPLFTVLPLIHFSHISFVHNLHCHCSLLGLEKLFKTVPPPCNQQQAH